MAISEICKFEVRDEIDHYVKHQGLSHRKAAELLAQQLTELMGEEVKAETLRKKAQRAEVGTSVPSDSTPPNHTKSPGNKENKGLTKEGKPRQRAPGAGRPKSKEVEEENVIIIFKQMKVIIYGLKRQKWNVVSRKTIIEQLQKLVDIAATE